MKNTCLSIRERVLCKCPPRHFDAVCLMLCARVLYNFCRVLSALQSLSLAWHQACPSKVLADLDGKSEGLFLFYSLSKTPLQLNPVMTRVILTRPPAISRISQGG